MKCYQILGVRPGATLSQVHRAYKRLVLRHHPDRTAGDPESLTVFCEATEAYATLKRAFALREAQRNLGPCPKCGRFGPLFVAFGGRRYCGDCLLARRRRLLPMPILETIKCLGVIGCQAAALYCTTVTMLYGDLHHGFAAVAFLAVGLVAMTLDFFSADVIER